MFQFLHIFLYSLFLSFFIHYLFAVLIYLCGVYYFMACALFLSILLDCFSFRFHHRFEPSNSYSFLTLFLYFFFSSVPLTCCLHVSHVPFLLYEFRYFCATLIRLGFFSFWLRSINSCFVLFTFRRVCFVFHFRFVCSFILLVALTFLRLNYYRRSVCFIISFFSF